MAQQQLPPLPLDRLFHGARQHGQKRRQFHIDVHRLIVHREMALDRLAHGPR